MTVVLVTGAASGIGAAVARRFGAAGASVVLADIDDGAGAAIAKEIDGLFVPADVSKPADNEAAVAAAIREFGGLDIVHLNAGIGGTGGLGDDFDIERYRRTIAVNLDGPVFGIHAALPVLTSTGGGSIVVTASLAGLAPAAFDPVYAATKHAVVGLVRSLAPTWIGSGITINALCPGFVDTAILPSQMKESLRGNGMAIADPAEIAAAVEIIAADGESGRAWMVQAGQPPAPFPFPTVELIRT
jgi:NAD(P)-dependent dehydrogenase (short-subunit alcohol dehydrogenase family)